MILAAPLPRMFWRGGSEGSIVTKVIVRGKKATPHPSRARWRERVARATLPLGEGRKRILGGGGA